MRSRTRNAAAVCAAGWALATGPGAPRPAVAQGNAFLPSTGNVTIAVSHTFESYEKYWMGDREVTDPGLGRVDTGSTTVWIQAGLGHDLALAANFAYVDVRSDGTAGLRDQGLQDRAFLLRYRFLHAERRGFRHSLVGGVGARLPASGYDPHSPVALGDGTKDALFRLVYQVQADFLRGAYVAVEGGYDARDEEAPDGFAWHGEVGATFSRLFVAAAVTGTAANGGSDIGDPGFTFPGLKEEWLRLGGRVAYTVSPHFGLALSGFTTLDGRNTGLSRGVSTTFIVHP